MRTSSLVGIAVVALASAVLVRAGVAATRGSVRERLVSVASGSRELMGKAEALPEKDAKMLGMEAVVVEDREREVAKRFARESEATAYLKLRPWTVAYRDWFSHYLSGAATESRPRPEDGDALRALLSDSDGQVRSLAAEALGTLGLPEDVEQIAGLLGDGAVGAVVLGWSRQVSSMAWASFAENPLLPERTWHDRKVGTYSREALKLMTGHRFDGKDPDGVSFKEWWKTHNLGKEALWYWQARLLREERAIVLMERKPGERNHEFWGRVETASGPYRAALHNATVAEIRALPEEVQAKIYLLTQKSPRDVEVDGPVNPFFPEGMEIMIGPGRWKELTEGKNLWPEVADVEGGRQLMLARMARKADQIMRGYGNPSSFKEALAKALEREAAGARWRSVLISRLKPPGALVGLDDPTSREGYLRKELALATEGYTREMIAAEMVRENLEAQWPVLEKGFYLEKRLDGSDMRIGILKALGEAPHTKEKTRRLAELLNDPRNEELFTQENRVMGMDMYRYWAMRGLDAIAGKKIVLNEVEEGFKDAAKAKWALGELRRLASDLSHQ